MTRYSTFYSDEQILYNQSYKLIECYDLHFQDSSSDKVYVLTLQENTSPLTEDTRYRVYCYYGRRYAGIAANHIGSYANLADAHKQMTKQMKSKTNKGYQHVGHYVDQNAKMSARGALGENVLSFLRQRFPKGALVQSPSGLVATVVEVTDTGALSVHIHDSGEVKEIPFSKYGSLEVKSDA